MKAQHSLGVFLIQKIICHFRFLPADTFKYRVQGTGKMTERHVYIGSACSDSWVM